jgi:hypothetical protein
MDKFDWSRTSIEEGSAAIPPPPTRKQEVDYLHTLESELRTKAYRNRYLRPDPRRHFTEYELYEKGKYRRGFWAYFGIGTLAASPLALGFANWLPTKTNMMGIPFRAYPFQHKIRFWSVFVAADLLGAYFFALWNRDTFMIEKHRFNLDATRRTIF